MLPSVNNTILPRSASSTATCTNTVHSHKRTLMDKSTFLKEGSGHSSVKEHPPLLAGYMRGGILGSPPARDLQMS